MKHLLDQKMKSKALSICLISSMLVGMFGFTGCQPQVVHEDLDFDHKCDCGCGESYGVHADMNKDHACDYGCDEAIGVCEDVNFDHKCDYGCDAVVGEHADADKDHACDYGCNEKFGDCKDDDKDHACDYGCDKSFGDHVDADLDHVCDYGCAEAIGDHVDTDLDHACDYGCAEVMGEHADANLDHKCDYGCAEVMGEHTDADKDHVCDYGCSEFIGVCADGNFDHKCDDGCSKVFGEHADADKDHVCDYGCSEVIGEHADANLDHACDYGCEEKLGSHADEDLDHVCDYGCEEAIGEHADADLDHACDYGCKEEIGEHADADLDHACDYGCKEALGAHADSDSDSDHLCDYGCKAEIGTHVYSQWQKNDADTHKHICNCGDIQIEAHVWDDGVDSIPATHTSAGEKTYTCKLCGETKTESIPALTGHTYNQKNTSIAGALVSEATCTAPAVYKLSCICGLLSESETFEDGVAAGHVPGDEVYENTVDSTCLVEGHYDTVVYCSVCETHEISRVSHVVPKFAHQDNDGDLTCDTCDKKFYVLTLTDATAKAESSATSAVANAFLAGEKVTIVADEYKNIDGKTYMFVGFDKNTTDNRIGENGVPTYTFEMPAEDVAITAKYAEANTTFLGTATWNSGEKYNPAGMVGTAYTNADGLAGWSFVIPDNALGTNLATNNLTTATITAWGIDQEKTVKFVLTNHGDYDVTVELWGEYFGFVCTTGNVTVPAHSTINAYMQFGPFSGAGTTCDFMIHVRENIGGNGEGTIQLDVVAAIAKTYETKISDLIVTSDKNIFMDFGESNESNTQANIAHASASGMNMRYWDQYGVMYFYGNNNTSADTFARERANAVGDMAIHLQNGEKFTIYVKVTNLYGGAGKYSLVFTRGSSSLNSAYLATQTIEFSYYGETKVFAIEIDPTKAGSSDNLQFGLKKAKADGTGGKVNVLVQIAGENIFGELSE